MSPVLDPKALQDQALAACRAHVAETFEGEFVIEPLAPRIAGIQTAQVAANARAVGHELAGFFDATKAYAKYYGKVAKWKVGQWLG